MMPVGLLTLFFFFFNDTATTEIYTLSLHDALPISARARKVARRESHQRSRTHHGRRADRKHPAHLAGRNRSEEHTSELQSRLHLVCRLLLEKKKNTHMSDHRDCAIQIIHHTYNEHY